MAPTRQFPLIVSAIDDLIILQKTNMNSDNIAITMGKTGVSIALTNFTGVIRIDEQCEGPFVKKKIVQLPAEKISTDTSPIPSNEVVQVPASPNLLESDSDDDTVTDTNAEDKKPNLQPTVSVPSKAKASKIKRFDDNDVFNDYEFSQVRKYF
jgi:hypothetical protein